jgi:hypothetical protein
MSERMSPKSTVRRSATAALVGVVVLAPAVHAKNSDRTVGPRIAATPRDAQDAGMSSKIIARSQLIIARPAIYPESVSQCVSASTSSVISLSVHKLRPKRPVVEVRRLNPGEQCDDLGKQANTAARFTTRVTLSEKLGEDNWMPIGRMVLKDAPIFPLAEGISGADRNVDAAGNMRLHEPMCKGPRKTYKVEASVETVVEEGLPLGIASELPTHLHRDALPSQNEIDTVGPPVDDATDPSMLNSTQYYSAIIHC